MVFSVSLRQRIKELTKYQIDQIEQMIGQDHVVNREFGGSTNHGRKAEVSKGKEKGLFRTNGKKRKVSSRKKRAN